MRVTQYTVAPVKQNPWYPVVSMAIGFVALLTGYETISGCALIATAILVRE